MCLPRLADYLLIASSVKVEEYTRLKSLILRIDLGLELVKASFGNFMCLCG